MANDDYELPDDEEEILVYVEFDGSVASNMLCNEKLQFEMIGLDKEHPIMQVNGKFYEGTYHNAVGTYLFFEGDKYPHVDDPVFDVTPNLKYKAKTRKVLRMNRIFVELKNELLGDSNNPECLPTMEAIKKSRIPLRYQKETLESWKKIREERMKALQDYLEKQRIREEKRSQGIEPDSASDDDNPFAAYKPPTKNNKAKQPQVPVEDLFNDSTSENAPEITDNLVTDPGPSTSKNSKPWTSPSSDKPAISNSDSEDVDRVNIPNFKSLHRATIQVPKRTKVRKFTKVGKKKLKKATSSGPGKNKEKPEPEKPEDTVLDEISEKTKDEEKSNEEPTNTLESMATLTIHNSTNELEIIADYDVPQCTEKTESLIDKKKQEKQRKRDDKMLLLSKKLKEAADERRLKSLHSQDFA